MKQRWLSTLSILILTLSCTFETECVAEDAGSSQPQTADQALVPVAKPTPENSAAGPVAKPAQKPPVRPGPVADTVLSPLGGYGTSPPPETGPYDAPDLAPITKLNEQLPRWIEFGLEERLRWEMPIGAGFKPQNDDSYLLNRFRFGMSLRPTSWFGVVAQLQDAHAMFLKPPAGPPNEVKWDLKQAYVKLFGSEASPVSIRVGRQIID